MAEIRKVEIEHNNNNKTNGILKDLSLQKDW